MSNGSKPGGLGEQFKSALNEAVSTGNYERLNELVSETVASAVNDAGAAASKAWQQKDEWKRRQEAMREQEAARSYEVRQEYFTRQQQEASLRAQQEKKRRQQQAAMVAQKKKNAIAPIYVKNVGVAAGVLYIVFGSIANIPLFILSLIGMMGSWGTTGALAFFWAVSVFFICHGKRKIQLVNRAKRYVRLCGARMFAPLNELAAQVGLPVRKVERDVRRILQKGIIPSAHMDPKGTHLMLNETVYRQYVDAENARLLREKEEKEAVKQLKTKKNEKPEIKVSEIVEEPKTQLEIMMEEGREYIQKLHDMNDLIPGEEISDKLLNLENLLQEIFSRVEKDPSQMGRMQKTMNYYLPTTLKLVEAYHEFDVVSTPNEDIRVAKQEIEATLDKINEAFVELLNSLYQDKVFDVTTDAQVLQTILANEGLTKDMDIMKADK